MKNRDLELIQRVHTGDEDAFTELVKKYQNLSSFFLQN